MTRALLFEYMLGPLILETSNSSEPSPYEDRSPWPWQRGATQVRSGRPRSSPAPARGVRQAAHREPWGCSQGRLKLLFAGSYHGRGSPKSPKRKTAPLTDSKVGSTSSESSCRSNLKELPEVPGLARKHGQVISANTERRECATCGKHASASCSAVLYGGVGLFSQSLHLLQGVAPVCLYELLQSNIPLIVRVPS